MDRSRRLAASGEACLFFFQWDQDDWKQALVIMAYVIIGIAGIAYVLLDAGELRTFLRDWRT